jgi:hypothetical protein
MKSVRFKGQFAVCFQNIGELKPEDTCWVPDEVAKHLLERGDFEPVIVRPAVKSSKLETDKTAPRGDK